MNHAITACRHHSLTVVVKHHTLHAAATMSWQCRHHTGVHLQQPYQAVGAGHCQHPPTWAKGHLVGCLRSSIHRGHSSVGSSKVPQLNSATEVTRGHNVVFRTASDTAARVLVPTEHSDADPCPGVPHGYSSVNRAGEEGVGAGQEADAFDRGGVVPKCKAAGLSAQVPQLGCAVRGTGGKKQAAGVEGARPGGFVVARQY